MRVLHMAYDLLQRTLKSAAILEDASNLSEWRKHTGNEKSQFPPKESVYVVDLTDQVKTIFSNGHKINLSQLLREQSGTTPDIERFYFAVDGRSHTVAVDGDHKRTVFYTFNRPFTESFAETAVHFYKTKSGGLRLVSPTSEGIFQMNYRIKDGMSASYQLMGRTDGEFPKQRINEVLLDINEDNKLSIVKKHQNEILPVDYAEIFIPLAVDQGIYPTPGYVAISTFYFNMEFEQSE